MNKVFIETYGCSVNQSDSEIMSGLLKQNGFNIVDSPTQSDLNIINTCIVKAPTENRMIHRINELTKMNKPLIIAGCMSKVEKNVIEKINPSASLLGPDSIQKITDVTRAALKGQRVVFLDDLRKPKVCLPRVNKSSVTHTTQISTGCSGNCSYCIVKLAKGNLFSYPADLIIKDITRAIKDGYKEIYLTSQDCGCYGKDIEIRLPSLLKKICDINGRFFIRIGMMNPLHTKEIVDELIHMYLNEEIFKFLHLPVQSGSNKVLKDMNRGYKVKDFIYIVEKFRKEIPKLTLSTDIIIGYPTETEKNFKETIDLIKKVKPDIVNISKFGPRPGTKAAKMKQLDQKIVDKRSMILHNLVNQISYENNNEWLRWEGEVIIDEKIKNNFVGRNFAYKPVFIDKKITLGEIVSVKISKITPNFLIGELQ